MILLFAIRRLHVATALAACLALMGCSNFPASGPATKDLDDLSSQAPDAAVQIVDVSDHVARQLLRQRQQELFSETLGDARTVGPLIGAGDSVEISIWEAPPATLFGTATDPRLGIAPARQTTLPDQIVDQEGFLTVPFAGRVRALGITTQALESEIVRRLRGKANQPEALVRVTRNPSSAVTVVGDVVTSVRMPLTPSGERLLDALAAAGGVRQPVNKMMLQVTRGKAFHAMPLDQVIRDPRQNVPLRPGDVVTALFQPFSFTALGATGRNEEVMFEAQGITLAQALARAGGLMDTRSDPKGVFVFRFETNSAFDWPRKPVTTTPDGMVPVVYRVDLRNPNSFFVMQNFPVQNKDVLYVSNAPTVELQKFLNVVFSIYFPLSNALSNLK